MKASPPAASDLIGSIAQAAAGASPAFARLSRYLLAAPTEFMHNSVQEIAHAAEVSLPTVLRFCRHHGYRGIPEFRIALAMSLASGSAPEPPAPFVEPQVSDKAALNLNRKLAIARYATAFVDTDQSLILDSGSTLAIFARFLRALPGRNILTTGLNVVEALWETPQHNVMLAAGTVRYESRSVTGRLVEATLAHMHFDTGYFGADSIDAAAGLSTFNEAEARQSAAMMNACTRVVVLADSSKFRLPRLHRICALDRIDTIVTDTGLPAAEAEALMARGPKVVCVEPEAVREQRPARPGRPSRKSAPSKHEPRAAPRG